MTHSHTHTHTHRCGSSQVSSRRHITCTRSPAAAHLRFFRCKMRTQSSVHLTHTHAHAQTHTHARASCSVCVAMCWTNTTHTHTHTHTVFLKSLRISLDSGAETTTLHNKSLAASRECEHGSVCAPLAGLCVCGAVCVRGCVCAGCGAAGGVAAPQQQQNQAGGSVSLYLHTKFPAEVQQSARRATSFPRVGDGLCAAGFCPAAVRILLQHLKHKFQKRCVKPGPAARPGLRDAVCPLGFCVCVCGV